MRKKRLLAWIMACSMLLGQNVWAKEADQEAVIEMQEQQESEISQDAFDQVTEPAILEEMILEENQGENESENEFEKEKISDTIADMQKETEETLSNPEKEMTEEESAEEESYVVEKRTVCVNYPVIVSTKYSYSSDIQYSEVKAESKDEGICKATAEIYEKDDYQYIYLTLEGIKKGVTTVDVKIEDRIVSQCEVTVNNLPEDAVMFNDIILRSCLSDPYADNDKNGDGCIDKSELEEMEGIGIFSIAGSVKDLQGLEGAVNLKNIILNGNVELSDINVFSKLKNLEYIDLENTKVSDISTLFELKNLKYVNLRNTKVSNSDRWKLADFKDFSLMKGEQINFPSLEGLIFDEELTVEAVSGQECVEIKDGRDLSSKIEKKILAKEAGEVKLHISYKELSEDIIMLIEGVSAEQDVGEVYDTEIKSKTVSDKNSPYADAGLILDSNSQLWQIYPVVSKKKSNVKDYVANWVYYGSGSECRTYLIDNDKVLWNGKTKLAEKVEKFDGRYALDSNGILHNIYNAGNEQVDQVVDWRSPLTDDEDRAYLLKKDGTLWTRQEVEENVDLNTFKKIESNVKQIYSWGYLKTGGEIVYFDGTSTTDIKADRICSDGSFYDADGNYYHCYGSYEWNEEAFEYINHYIKIGKIDVKDKEEIIHSVYDGPNMILKKDSIYILDHDKQVYEYDKLTGKLTKVMSGVTEINKFYYDVGRDDGMDWVFKTSDGKYHDLDGNLLSKVKICQSGETDLVLQGNGMQSAVRNGVTILNNVVSIWSDYIQDTVITYALRTDGKIWDITGIPKQILDLQSASYIKGDVNEDGDVNIKDLQIVLRGVCEKIELTERQKMIADVVEDGKVDIQDLRKELRFVCGKIESL